MVTQTCDPRLTVFRPRLRIQPKRHLVGKTMRCPLLTPPKPCVLPLGAHHLLGPRARGRQGSWTRPYEEVLGGWGPQGRASPVANQQPLTGHMAKEGPYSP